MDGLDEPENRVKLPDSAYSTSCSNSQSQRSQSSKSTNSSSNSSGSSGYGGKPSTSCISNKQSQPTEKRSKEKDGKKKSKSSHTEAHIESTAEVEARPQELEQKAESDKKEAQENDPAPAPAPQSLVAQPAAEKMDIASSDCALNVNEEVPANKGKVKVTASQAEQLCAPQQSALNGEFACLISIQDGVVMYATSTITASLGFSKEMWIGRSFIDFVHPKDSSTFASQIMNVIMPKNNTAVVSSAEPPPEGAAHTMYCRMRSYRNLGNGFGIKHNVMAYRPFSLNLTFKDIYEGEGKVPYLLLQATPLQSAYKLPLEPVLKPKPFVTRHMLSRKLQFVDRDSIPYLGYLPQEIGDTDALMLYHPDDLAYLLKLYEIVVQKGSAAKSKVYRMQAQNGDYVKLETEFSSFINPWSKKLEFISGRHYVVEGPLNPDVFQLPQDRPQGRKNADEQNAKAQKIRDRMARLMHETLDSTKQQTSRRCFEVTSYMESVTEEPSKLTDDLAAELHDPDNSYYERDSVMLGGISPHHESDVKSTPDTPLSYTMLNYNETLQRYFDSYMAEESDSSDQGKAIVEAEMTGDYQVHRLTKPLLIKHNTVMEKELVRRQRKHRSSTNNDTREKALMETRLKKQEHLTRCKAPFKPATEGSTQQPHGVKRACQSGAEESARKHHSTWAERSRRPDALAVLRPQPLPASLVAQVAPQAPQSAPQAMQPAPQAPQLATHVPQSAPQDMQPALQFPQSALQFPQSAPQVAQTAPQIMQPVPQVSQSAPQVPQSAPQTAQSAPQAMPSAPQAMQPAPQVLQSAPHFPQSVPQPMPQAMPRMTLPQAAPTIHASMPTQTFANTTAATMANQWTVSGMNAYSFSQAQMPQMPGMPGAMAGGVPVAMPGAMPMQGGMPAILPPGVLPPGAIQGPYLMYGQMLTPPMMYPHMGQVTTAQWVPAPLPQIRTAPLQLPSRNYEEVCDSGLGFNSKSWRDTKRLQAPAQSSASSKTDLGSGISGSGLGSSCSQPFRRRRATESRASSSMDLSTGNSGNESNDRRESDESREGNTDSAQPLPSTADDQYKVPKDVRANRVACRSVDRMNDSAGQTDSSSSSFCSSYFKTDFGSVTESETHKNKSYYKGWSSRRDAKSLNKRLAKTMPPSWMEPIQVDFNYQIPSKTLKEALASDVAKLAKIEQPSLVNEQLAQLYLDLQLDGLPPSLALEELLSSSGSSGEESNPNPNKVPRRKRDYSSLVMVYEEDAPMPPPPPGAELLPQPLPRVEGLPCTSGPSPPGSK